MPLAVPGLALLGERFFPLFDPDRPITDTATAAATWARAYFGYASAGNVVVPPPKEQLLAADLTTAFNPLLNGGGRGLFLLALTAFWVGIPATVPPGIVTYFVPSGSIDSNVANDATPQEQAEGLADIIHQMTIASAKVLPPPPAPPVLVPVT